MKSRIDVVLGIALAGLSLVSARAEVRVVGGTAAPVFSVRTTSSGPWASPGGGLPEGLVNPAGDFLGDGFPAIASAPGEALAAWLRPAASELVIHRVRGTSRSEHAVAVTAASGVPVIVRLPEAWLVAWTSGADVHGLILDGGLDPGSASVLQEGRLIGGAATPQSALLVSIDLPTGEFVVGRVVHFIPLPSPIPDVKVRGLALPGRDGARALEPQDVPPPCITLSGAGERALVSWKAGDGLLGSVTLRDGVFIGPDFRKGSACPAARP